LTHKASYGVATFLPWISVNIKGTKESVAKVATADAADHGSREWSVLLATLAQTESHGQHADDHCKARHDDGAQDDGAQARVACGQRCLRRELCPPSEVHWRR
jgi:hypothetical protein